MFKCTNLRPLQQRLKTFLDLLASELLLTSFPFLFIVKFIIFDSFRLHWRLQVGENLFDASPCLPRG